MTQAVSCSFLHIVLSNSILALFRLTVSFLPVKWPASIVGPSSGSPPRPTSGPEPQLSRHASQLGQLGQLAQLRRKMERAVRRSDDIDNKHYLMGVIEGLNTIMQRLQAGGLLEGDESEQEI
ncbi:hypothetical protein B0T10DRAFT_501009 [Thelonectria olida]|uniref:Uncharacterized protein n=1 Tax=Thelonectria olida TaxID=1576542 RepID=A0A9P8VSV8_9HYPO|nr:hypothetical protein B0T10DRAFT_501009 [Thelonectria olida]